MSQRDRFHVVAVDKAAGRLRVKAVEDVLPGDIITMEQPDGQVRGITVEPRVVAVPERA